MGLGWGWALLAALLVPAPALRCGDIPCPSPLDVCRRTTLTTLTGGRVLRQEEGGCDLAGPPDVVVVTFRSHGEVVTLREERCRGGGDGDCPAPAAPPRSPPAARPLLCPTCDASDGSCHAPLAALPCPRPTDYCLDVITRGPGEVGEGRIRGCGRAGACRGLLALDSGRGRRVALSCCQSDQCEPGEEPPPVGLRCWACEGPEPHCAPQVLPCGGGRSRCALARTYGPSGEPWLVRGCATPAWCETPLGVGGLRGGALPHCCRGSLCNRLPGDPPPPSAAPPGASSAFGLLLLLLLAAPHII
ncbi:urokinase plasminogen activator surface receptor isoform X1 [Buteo buteo]|uniref:urokinase plasminogen activator surface receptor isoform X1 n=1 Tax=Buteo buteo TaxID=30397 RepID=UPI003EB8562C